MTFGKTLSLSTGCIALGLSSLAMPLTMAQAKATKSATAKKAATATKAAKTVKSTTNKPGVNPDPGAMAGVATIIKGNGNVTNNDGLITIIPSGPDGVIVVTGLMPGGYSVKPVGNAQTAPVQTMATLNDMLLFQIRGSGMNRDILAIQNTGAVPAGAINVQAKLATVTGTQCEALTGAILCASEAMTDYVDVNRSSAAQITAMAPKITPAAAALIVAGRAKGAYTSPADFLSRVCAKANVDFGTTSVLVGNTRMIGRSDLTNAPTLRCTKAGNAGTSQVKLYSDSFPLTQASNWLP